MNALLYILLYMSRLFCLALPGRMALALGRLLGTLGFYIFKKRRALALQNIRQALALDAKKSKEIVYQSFQHLGMNLIEFLRFQKITTHNFHRFITFHGLEHLEKAYQQHKGILALTAHLGNWELLAASVALSGFNTSMIVKKARQTAIENFLTQQRENKKIKLFAGKNQVKLIFKQLAAGGIVGIVLDQSAVKSEGVCVPFFNRPAWTLKSLAVLATRTPAVVLPMFIYRDANFHHHVIIEAPIENNSNNIDTLTAQYNLIIEKVIREHPEQWIWTHNRWKDRE